MNYSSSKEIAVLVSGGVDSSAVLHRLVSQGFSVRAYYLKIWLADELSHLGSCPWEEDLFYAESLCKKLNVPFEIISMQHEYWDNVVTYTLDEIKKGNTPNPDMLCNREVKLGAFLKTVDHLHDFVATGHYARRIDIDGKMYLSMTDDEIKDQTYFLAQVPYDQLKRAIFPLGDLIKNQVRDYALKHDIPAAKRADSQGICFLGKISFKEFIKHHLGTMPGDLVEYETGKKVGIHEGYWFYTIGQRQGIGLSGGPWYVVKKSIDENIIYVSRSYYSEDKIRNKFIISQCNILSDELVLGQKYFAKLRHGPKINEVIFSNKEGQNYYFDLLGNDQGIASGQFAVIYNDKKICIGSGVIQ